MKNKLLKIKYKTLAFFEMANAISINSLKYFLYHWIWKFPYDDEKILNMSKKEQASYLKKKYFFRNRRHNRLQKT